MASVFPSVSRLATALPRLAPPLLALVLALGAAGCQSSAHNPLATTTLEAPPPPGDEAGLRAYAARIEPRYAANPEDRALAINYAKALRGLTQHAQAVAVLQRVAVKYPHDMIVLAAYGKALADAGRLQEASEVLERSHTPELPNWSVLSAQGSVADQMGDHARAQGYYSAALKIVPNQPQVLSNLGLSYALERRMPNAETTLRQAAAQPSADMRIRQNLALVLSLEGKYGEAEEVSRRDMAPVDAAENVASIKRMIVQSDTWKTMSSQPRSQKVAARKAKPPLQTAAVEDGL